MITPILISAAILWLLVGLYHEISWFPVFLHTFAVNSKTPEIQNAPTPPPSFVGGLFILITFGFLASVGVLLGPIAVLTKLFGGSK